MVDLNKLISKLESPKASERFDACEELRVTPSINDQAIAALERVLEDSDQLVRQSAESALRVHKSGFKSRRTIVTREAITQSGSSLLTTEKSVSNLKAMGIGIISGYIGMFVCYLVLVDFPSPLFVDWYLGCSIIGTPFGILGALIGKFTGKKLIAAWVGGFIGGALTFPVLAWYGLGSLLMGGS